MGVPLSTIIDEVDGVCRDDDDPADVVVVIGGDAGVVGDAGSGGVVDALVDAVYTRVDVDSDCTGKMNGRVAAGWLNVLM